MKKRAKKVKESSRKDKMMVLLEDMREEIKTVAEGHTVLLHKLEEHDKKFEQIDSRFEKIDDRFAKIDSRFDEQDKKFQQIFEYLSRIEDELMEIKNDLKNNYERKGWDAEWRKMLEEKVKRIEKAMIAKKLMRA